MAHKPDIEAAVYHILNGLVIDGAHHKQWDMEQALIALKGKEWVEENNIDDSNPDDIYPLWDEGIPA